MYPERDPCSQGEESAATEERGWTEIPLALATGEIEWIQERVDQLTAAAKGGDDFSESDKEFLKDLYWWIGAGGYAKGLGEASQLQRRYVSPQAKNEPVEIDAEVYQTSTIVQYAMKEMKRIIAEDIAGTGAIRDDGEIWSTDVLSPTRQGDQATLGEIIKGGYLLAEQDNKRLKYANNRFALKSFSETREGFFPWEADRSVKTRWRVDDVWDFASFEEQKEKKREDITHIPLPNGAVLKLPDGLSEYMVDQGRGAGVRVLRGMGRRVAVAFRTGACGRLARAFVTAGPPRGPLVPLSFGLLGGALACGGSGPELGAPRLEREQGTFLASTSPDGRYTAEVGIEGTRLGPTRSAWSSVEITAGGQERRRLDLFTTTHPTWSEFGEVQWSGDVVHVRMMAPDAGVARFALTIDPRVGAPVHGGALPPASPMRTLSTSDSSDGRYRAAALAGSEAAEATRGGLAITESDTGRVLQVEWAGPTAAPVWLGATVVEVRELGLQVVVDLPEP